MCKLNIKYILDKQNERITNKTSFTRNLFFQIFTYFVNRPISPPGSLVVEPEDQEVQVIESAAGELRSPGK